MAKWIWIKNTIGESFFSLFALIKMKKANNKEYEHIQVNKIKYGKHENQHMLVFEPIKDSAKQKFIFFIHGGGWTSNNPTMFKFVGGFFAQMGYMTVSVGYRLAPDYTYPTQIEDVFSGFKKAFDIVDEKYVDKKQAIIIGSSSGAHLGSILAYDQKRQAEYKIESDRISGLVSNAGPLNFKVCQNPIITKLIGDFMGGSKELEHASPMEIIKDYKALSKIPTLCIHGEKDPVIEIENSQTFVDYINNKNKGQIAEVFKAKGSYHSDLCVYLFSKEIEAKKKLVQWLRDRE